MECVDAVYLFFKSLVSPYQTSLFGREGGRRGEEYDSSLDKLEGHFGGSFLRFWHSFVTVSRIFLDHGSIGSISGTEIKSPKFTQLNAKSETFECMVLFSQGDSNNIS